ncbi:hypothetical protein N5J77_25590, partial [Sphingobium yanoikuyae]
HHSRKTLTTPSGERRDPASAPLRPTEKEIPMNIDPRLTFDDIINYARCGAMASHIGHHMVAGTPHPSADDRLTKLRDAMANLVIEQSRNQSNAAEAFADVERLRENCTADRAAAAKLNILAVC